MKKYLTIPDVMERFNVGMNTVLTWLHTKQLRGTNFGTRKGLKRARWKISEEAIAAFEIERTIGAPAARKRRRKTDRELVDFVG